MKTPERNFIHLRRLKGNFPFPNFPLSTFNFTLIEIIIVITVLLMLTALVAGRVGGFPVVAGMDKTVSEIERLFAESGYLAGIKGREAQIEYAPERKVFRIVPEAEQSDDADSRYLYERFKSVVLPKEMEAEFPSLPEHSGEAIRFQAYPDGTAFGPDMILKLHTYRVRFKISPLTGQLVRQDNRGRK